MENQPQSEMTIHLIKDGQLHIMTVPKGSKVYEKLEDVILDHGERFKIPNEILVNHLKIVKDETETEQTQK